MSARENPATIGAFVVGAVALLLTALLVWGGTDIFRTKVNYVLFFDAAVTGLSKGAPVLGRGVKVGEVTDIQIRWGTPMVAVYIALEPDAVKGAAEGGPRQAVERLDEREIRHSGVKDRGFMDSIYFEDPLGLLIELASYRFEPPYGYTHADVLLEAHKIRVERGDYNIAQGHLADAVETLVRRSRASLSDDRSPKDPYD